MRPKWSASAKAHRPYEFGVKVSVATPLQRCRGGQFVAHVAALPGNPYDGCQRRLNIPQKWRLEIPHFVALGVRF
jgi:hypothetical protein